MRRDRHLRIYSLACVGCPRNIHCGFGRTEIAQSRDPLPALLARQSCHQVHVGRLVQFLIKQSLQCRSASLDKDAACASQRQSVRIILGIK